MESKVSNGLGIMFLLLALFLVLRPGTPIRTRASIFLEERRIDLLARDLWPTIAASAQPIESDGVEINLVEVVDYRCGYCKAFEDTLTNMRSGGTSLRLGFLQLPRPGDSLSRVASAWSICGGMSGQFNAMHNFLMSANDLEGVLADPLSGADRAGLRDPVSFTDCVVNGRFQERLSADSLIATKLNILGTPTFISVRGGVHEGVVSPQTLAEWIEGS